MATPNHDKNGHAIDKDGKLVFDPECRGCDAPKPPQSIENIVKKFHSTFYDLGTAGYLIGTESISLNNGEKIKSFLRQALTSAIQVERKRIIKLLPKESEIPSYDQASVSYTAGWNDYRREALKAITQE